MLKFLDAKGREVSITAQIDWFDKDLQDEDIEQYKKKWSLYSCFCSFNGLR